MKIKQISTVLLLTAALILTFDIPAGCKAKDTRILLMRCYQQEDGSRSEAVFLDDDGCVWQYQGDSPLPETDKKRLAFLEKCRDAELIRQLEANRVSELESLISAAGDPQMEKQPCEKTCDCGLDTYSAVRYESKGAAEFIPLAVTGSEVTENLEPNAYALYTACFTEVMGYNLESEMDCPVKPMNVQSIPLAKFIEADENLFDGAEITAGIQDCEAGYMDLELEEDELKEKLEWLSGLVVTGKRNAMSVTGDTNIYTLYSPEGDILARFEFYGRLLVTENGMYSVETLET